jgi:hypothetical protein
MTSAADLAAVAKETVVSVDLPALAKILLTIAADAAA